MYGYGVSALGSRVIEACGFDGEDVVAICELDANGIDGCSPSGIPAMWGDHGKPLAGPCAVANTVRGLNVSWAISEVCAVGG